MTSPPANAGGYRFKIPDLGRAHVPQRHPRATTVSLCGEPERPSFCSPRTGEPVAHTRSSYCREKPPGRSPCSPQPEKSPSGGKGPAQPKIINRQNNFKKQNPMGESARLSRRGTAVFLFLFFILFLFFSYFSFFLFFSIRRPGRSQPREVGRARPCREQADRDRGCGRAWTCTAHQRPPQLQGRGSPAVNG